MTTYNKRKLFKRHCSVFAERRTPGSLGMS